jgi:hypothetical protein
MTDATPPPPHPDDERLSALLDGEGRAGDDAHVETCAACGARLAQLRLVAAAVGAPVSPPEPAPRRAAIAAALAAAPERHRGEVVPLGRARRRTGAPRWLAAAAAVVLVALAVPLVARAVDRQEADDVTTGATLSAQDSSGEAASATTTGPSALLGVARDAGDLGQIDAGTDLPARLGLGSRPASAGAPEAATTTAVPPGDRDDETSAATGAGAACEAVLREDDPQLGALLASAQATFDGERVTVLGFDAGGRARVYAVAVDTCAVRTVQTAR